jgi:hypothetical protein
MKKIIYATIYFISMEWACKKYLNFSPLTKAKEAINKVKNK